jgi:hypothetical protein
MNSLDWNKVYQFTRAYPIISYFYPDYESLQYIADLKKMKNSELQF